MMATTVNDDSLKRSLVVSAALHLFFLLFLYFGLPTLFTPLPQYHPPVPFEIVTIADITNTRIKQEEPKPEPKPETPPPPKPETKPELAPAPQSLPQPKPQEELALPAKKPPVKPKPPEHAKPKADEFTKLLKNLEAKKPEVQKTETKTEAKAAATPQDNQAPALSNRLTISEEDAVRRQVEQCWSPPIGARNAQTMVVQVTGDITPDGMVQNAEVVDKSRMATDPFYRSMGESAIRALYNPQCTPLKLPPDKYEDWKHFVFTFDPRDLL